MWINEDLTKYELCVQQMQQPGKQRYVFFIVINQDKNRNFSK